MIKGGSKLRHFSGSNLLNLEKMIEDLGYKTEIVNVNYVGQNWYVHFYVPDLKFGEPKITIKEKAIETTSKKVKKKKG